MRLVLHVSRDDLLEILRERVQRQYPNLRIGTITPQFSGEWERKEFAGYEIEVDEGNPIHMRKYVIEIECENASFTANHPNHTGKLDDEAEHDEILSILDSQHRVLEIPVKNAETGATEVVSGPVAVTRGILDSSLVHPRETFKPAILHGAAAVILVHNHPSGDPTPSADDRVVTEQMVAAGRLLDIPVHDHVIRRVDVSQPVRAPRWRAVDRPASSDGGADGARRRVWPDGVPGAA